MKNILAILCVSFALYTGFNIVFAEEPVYHTQVITVRNGDTMWKIASRWRDEKEDVREVMYRICEANNLQSKHVYSGQVLKIPVRTTANDFMMAGR